MEYHDNHQSYIETEIPNFEKEEILKRFKFKDDLKELAGRVVNKYIYDVDSAHLYYVIEDGYAPYGYIVFSLEKNGNGLDVYEYYGD